MGAPRSLRSTQRIISLPITRLRNSSATLDNLSRKALVFYQFQIHLSKSRKENSSPSRWQPKGGWIHWAQSKASSTWAGFGQAPEGTWKRKLFRMGERLVDRLDYEELALKGVDPALGPTIFHLDPRGKGEPLARPIAIAGKNLPQIRLLYPPSIQDSESSLGQLRQLIHAREPKHKKGFWIWMIIAPFTAPFMLIPIIPNIPFFFCVWRSWSHYRAYRASQYLSALIRHGHVTSTPSLELDAIYKAYGSKSLTVSSAKSTTSPQDPRSPHVSTQSTTDHVELLLTRKAVLASVSTFSLEESSASDMYRAIEQAHVRIESQR
ncbi:mitochondrial K+-H+ exchange-related-domain-containing protein [Lentinula raphanica]|nr:mitochondrial K+-H+ exchange-related-domain-containing protein [Lentinula raphanica]